MRCGCLRSPSDHGTNPSRRLALRHARSIRPQGRWRLSQDIRCMAQECIALGRFHSRCLRRREQDGISLRGRRIRRYPLDRLWSVNLSPRNFDLSVRHLITASSAYEDLEWISKLVEYTASLVRSKSDVKLFGTSDRKLVYRTVERFR